MTARRIASRVERTLHSLQSLAPSPPTTATAQSDRTRRTNAARSVSALADVFEPGVSRRIMGRRTSHPCETQAAAAAATTQGCNKLKLARRVQPTMWTVDFRSTIRQPALTEPKPEQHPQVASDTTEDASATVYEAHVEAATAATATDDAASAEITHVEQSKAIVELAREVEDDASDVEMLAGRTLTSTTSTVTPTAAASAAAAASRAAAGSCASSRTGASSRPRSQRQPQPQPQQRQQLSLASPSPPASPSTPSTSTSASIRERNSAATPATTRSSPRNGTGTGTRYMGYEQSEQFLAERQRNQERREKLTTRQQQLTARRRQDALQSAINKSSTPSSGSTVETRARTPSSSSSAGVSSRVLAFESDPRWLAQCAESQDRRRQLAARHERDAERRWQSPQGCADRSTSRLNAMENNSPSVTSPAVPSRVNAHESDPRWVAHCAQSRERRRELTAKHYQEAARRWQSSSSLQSADSSNVSDNAEARARSVPTGGDVTSRLTAFKRDPRWLAQYAENYARADKVRAARRIKPIVQ